MSAKNSFSPLCIAIILLLFASAACTMNGGSSYFYPTSSGKGGGGSNAGGKTKGPKGTKPYTIKGITYYPIQSGTGYSEEGIASWYGPDFHGKQTANGEVYDMHGMTAAHKILPFNTNVKVTNLSNGKSITVRVNDRGPFVGNRCIDLTHEAAKELAMLGPGTCHVKIESVGAVAGLTSQGDMSGSFYVQVGAFRQKDNASRLSFKIKATGKGSRYIYADAVNFWRVQIGPYKTLKEAEAAKSQLRGEFPAGFVVAE